MDSKDNINWIFKVINSALHDADSRSVIRTISPDPGTINPETFNRMMVTINGEAFTISIFKPAEVPVDAVEPEKAPPLELSQEVQSGFRSFNVDHRSNPGLHKLYIGWALHDLEIVGRALKEMQEVSRWPMSFIASTLQEAMGREILDDAAWFEAAALIHAGVDTREYPVEREESLEEQQTASQSLPPLSK